MFTNFGRDIASLPILCYNKIANHKKGDVFMYFEYLVSALILFPFIKAIIDTIKTKNIRDLLICLLSIPFQIFIISVILLGGSAFHDAANDYELYQAGHYYLVSHGQWTEVSYPTYIFVLVSGIVAILTFPIAFVLSFFRAFSIKE